MNRALVIAVLLVLGPLGGCTKNMSLQADQPTALFRVSGAEQQLLAVKPQILAGLEERRAAIPGPTLTALRASINEQFDDGILSNFAVESIREQWDANHGQSTLNWLNSDIGRKITALEEHAASPEGLAELEAFAKELESFRPDDARIALVRRLNESVNGTEMAVDSSLAIALAIAVGHSDPSQVSTAKNIEALRKKIFAERELLLAPMDRAILVYFIHTYASLENTEILRYVDFLESAAGRWYVNTTADAFVQPLINLSITLGEIIRDTSNHRSSNGA